MNSERPMTPKEHQEKLAEQAKQRAKAAKDDGGIGEYKEGRVLANRKTRKFNEAKRRRAKQKEMKAKRKGEDKARAMDKFLRRLEKSQKGLFETFTSLHDQFPCQQFQRIKQDLVSIIGELESLRTKGPIKPDREISLEESEVQPQPSLGVAPEGSSIEEVDEGVKARDIEEIPLEESEVKAKDIEEDAHVKAEGGEVLSHEIMDKARNCEESLSEL